MQRKPLIRLGVLSAALSVLPAAASAAPLSHLSFAKPPMRWLWGGFGFHNAEASMTAMMSDEFREERAMKTFLEISPTYARVFAGFAKWSKDEMDRFADYYNLTFRVAGTTLYVVPCRMPMITETFDYEAYAEQVAANLAYLVKERGCTRICFYCVTNETSVGPIYAWFTSDGHWDEYVKLNRAVYNAFRRHGLEIGLMTPDSSGESHVKDIQTAIDRLGDITETYCWHLYDTKAKAGALDNYGRWTNLFSRVVQIAAPARRRISLGEFGISGTYSPAEEQGCGGVMRDGRCYSERFPTEAPLAAITRAEMGLAAMNAGFVNAVLWTMTDYPDPFLGYPGGDTPREIAEHEAKDRAAFALDQNYNKWGLFRWCDDERDYSARDDLYTMGFLMKFFKRGARVLPWRADDATLRGGGVTNPDGSCSLAVINWGEAKEVEVAVAHRISKPMRLYVYDSANVPRNPFNDLPPPAADRVGQTPEGTLRVTLPAKSMVFLTSDYSDLVPSPVTGLRLEKGALAWDFSPDADHRFYRVYRDGRQIASTAATRFSRGIGASDDVSRYRVTSVNRWGNERQPE